MRLVFLLQLLSTLSLSGLIWFVQIVHYPLFLFVGETQLREYATRHATRTTWVVAPLMLLELLSTCALLVPSLRPAFASTREVWVGFALVMVIWLSTAFLQVPVHNQLQSAPSADAIGRLVATNWIRTIAWSLRSALVLAWAYRLAAAAIH